MYRTFVRTQPPSAKMAKSLLAALSHFGWDRVVVVTSNNGVYGPIYSAFQVRNRGFFILRH